MDNKQVIIIVSAVFSILLIICIIFVVLYKCPIETEHIPYFDKKILSNEHFNGSYLNNDIIARRVKKKGFHKNLQIRDHDSKWKDIVFGNKNFYEEDPRIFKTNDHLYPYIIMWTQVNSMNYKEKSIMLFASLLDIGKNSITIIKLYDPENPKSIQKNWILLNADNIHDTHWVQWFGPVYKTIRVNMFTGEIKEGWKTKGIANLRGGSPLFEYNNKLYGVCHITKYFPRKISLQLIEIDNKIPYKISRISKEFTFTKNPTYEFPCGIKFDGIFVYILLGINDTSLVEIKMKIKDFIGNLTNI